MFHRFFKAYSREFLGEGKPFSILRMVKVYLIGDLDRQAVLQIRVAQYFRAIGCKKLSRIVARKVSLRFGIYVSESSCIGEGMRLPHPESIVIGNNIRIGKDARIYQQVTIGAGPRACEESMPRMGDDVVVYPGAKFVGVGCVGNNVVVGANAVVTRRFGDNLVLAGSPARAIRELKPGEVSHGV